MSEDVQVSDQQAVDDGLRAGQILQDDVFKKAVAAARKSIIEAWEAATTAEAREKAHAELRALSTVMTKLGALQVDGEMAAHKAKLRGKTRH